MRAMSDSEHTATTPMSSSDVKSESSHIECASSPSEFEPEWSAGTSEEESRARVGVPSVAMPVAPAGVSPIAAGPKMDGDPQVTSVAMTSPAVAVPVVPMDVVGAPPPLAATPPRCCQGGLRQSRLFEVHRRHPRPNRRFQLRLLLSGCHRPSRLCRSARLHPRAIRRPRLLRRSSCNGCKLERRGRKRG